MKLADAVGDRNVGAAVEYGCLRVRDLTEIYQGTDMEARLAALTTVWEYFGLDDEAKANLGSLITAALGSEQVTAALVGFLVALYSFDYES